MKNQYLTRHDKCQVTANHGIHGGRRGKVFGFNEHCPVGTSEITTKVIIRCDISKELFDVDHSQVVKLDKNNHIQTESSTGANGCASICVMVQPSCVPMRVHLIAVPILVLLQS